MILVYWCEQNYINNLKKEKGLSIMNNFIIKCHVNAMLRFEQFCKDQKGVTAIEYALIGVAMATLLAFILGDQDSGFLGALKDTFGKISGAIKAVTISSGGN